MAMESNPPRAPKTPNSVISFSNFDFKGTDQNLHDPMVNFVVAGNYIIRKVLVDASTLQKMQIPESNLNPYHGDFVGFSREWVNVQ